MWVLLEGTLTLQLQSALNLVLIFPLFQTFSKHLLIRAFMQHYHPPPHQLHGLDSK